MALAPERIEEVVSEIAALPQRWHAVGPLPEPVLRAMVRHTGAGQVSHSMETGAGKSTLLLSHLSLDHKVFCVAGSDDSLEAVRASALFNRSTVEFIEGPTQLTLPGYRFSHKLQLALLDGPHAYPFPDLEYYYVYPQLETDALLIVDDIHIPTIFKLFSFLREDAMFRLLEVVGTTAFFRRTSAPVFDPLADNWWTQNYNLDRFPLSRFPEWGGLRPRVRSLVPIPLRKRIKALVPGRLRKRLGRWMMS